MKLSLPRLEVLVKLEVLMVVAGLGGCSGSQITLQGAVDGGVVYGPTGVTQRLSISASNRSSLSVALAPQPGTITVSPSTVTTDDYGNATAFAFVPYGTEGVVVASATSATSSSIPVQCAPINLCDLTVELEPGGGEIGPTGQVYSVSVQAAVDGPCGSGNPAPAGISLIFAAIQPSGSGTTSTASGGGIAIANAIATATVLTDPSGTATANLLIPWGADTLVQVAGGGALASTPVIQSGSPIALQGGAVDGGVVYGPTGVTERLSISAGDHGSSLSVALVPQPSTITVSPSTVTTDDSGNATAFAFVPYGTEGVVVASATFATAASIPVRCDALSLCDLTVGPELDGGDIGSTGQVYSASVQGVLDGPCGGGMPAPAGISLIFAVLQPSGSGATSIASGAGMAIANAIATATVLTDPSGTATATLLIPWGADAWVQVAGGGALASTLIPQSGSTPQIGCLSWNRQAGGIYEFSADVVAQVGNSTEGVPGVVVNYSLLSQTADAGTVVAIGSAVTNANGVATIFDGIAGNASLPIIVEAVTGGSVLTATVDGSDSGQSQHCAN